MRKIYTPQRIMFLKQNVKGRSMADLTKLFNRRFRLSATATAIKACCGKHGLKSGFKPRPTWNVKYLPKHIRWLEKNIPGHHYADVLPVFNKRFGFSLTVIHLASLCKRVGIQTGFTGYFPKGNVPVNKGKKGYYFAGSEKGWFRPGHPGYKYKERPVGSERITVDGYVEVKISDKPTSTNRERQRRWRMKHVVIWERENGPLPKGHCIIFLDKNKMNFALDNLFLVSRQVHSVMCHMNWYTDDKKTTSAYLAIAMNTNATQELKRKTFDMVKNKKLVVLSRSGTKYVIAEIIVRGQKKYCGVRKDKNGELHRMVSPKIKARATKKEAEKDLQEYAKMRGWQRI